MESWSFLTNHARALLCIARDPGVRLRDIAAGLGITERSAHAIVTDLTTAGYVVKHKDGRRNRYQIQEHLPLPEPASHGPAIGDCWPSSSGSTMQKATTTPLTITRSVAVGSNGNREAQPMPSKDSPPGLVASTTASLPVHRRTGRRCNRRHGAAGLTSIVRSSWTDDHCDGWDPLPEPPQSADAHPAWGPVDLPFITGRRCQGAASDCSAMCRPVVWMALALLNVLVTFGTWPTAARRPHQPATRYRLSAHLWSGSVEGHGTKGSGRGPSARVRGGCAGQNGE